MKLLIISLLLVSCGQPHKLESSLIMIKCTSSIRLNHGLIYLGEVQDFYLKDGYWIVVEKNKKRIIRISGHCRRIN